MNVLPFVFFFLTRLHFLSCLPCVRSLFRLYLLFSLMSCIIYVCIGLLDMLPFSLYVFLSLRLSAFRSVFLSVFLSPFPSFIFFILCYVFLPFLIYFFRSFFSF